MNRFGLNSAALNGAATSIIAGAALVTSLCSATALGTRTQFPEAVVSNVASSADATGTRIVNGAATVTQVTTTSAQWALLTMANVNIVVVGNIKATATEAYAVGQSSGAASGFITQNGKATSTSQGACTATPLVTIGYATNINVNCVVTADASVKLNGTSLWQRDGYAQTVSSQAVVTANPLRTAYGTAIGSGVSSATTDSIKQHGGAATISSSLEVFAQPSIESVKINVTANVTAIPLVTQFGAASAETTSSAVFNAVAITPGFVEPIVVQSSATALGRHAILGEANVVGISSVSASGRLAELGAASVDVTSVLDAKGTIIVNGMAITDITSSASAIFSVIRQSQASITVNAIVTAFGAKNVNSAAPDYRSMVIDFEDRLMQVPSEDRTMKVES